MLKTGKPPIITSQMSSDRQVQEIVRYLERLYDELSYRDDYHDKLIEDLMKGEQNGTN